MAIQIGAVVRASVRMSGPIGQDIINVWHWKLAGPDPVDEADFLDGIDEFVQNMYGEIQLEVANTVSGVDIKCDVVQAIAGKWQIVQNIGTVPWSFSGSAAADNMPAGVCALGFLRTTIGKVFGRKFAPPFTETQWVGTGELGSNEQADVIEWLTAGMIGPNLGGGTFFGVIPSIRTLNAEPIIAVDVTPEPGYQRRRSPRSGS